MKRKHVLIINGNPDPAADRLSSALANSYAEGALSAGHEIRRINIGALPFPLLRHATDFTAKPTAPQIRAAQESFLWANHLVFIYPLWLGGAPALLKGFMENLACGEFLLGASKGFPKGKLKGRSARVVVTMGMPAIFYKILYGAHGIKAFQKSILGLAGIGPIRTSCIGGVGMSAVRMARWVKRVRQFGVCAT